MAFDVITMESPLVFGTPVLSQDQSEARQRQYGNKEMSRRTQVRTVAMAGAGLKVRQQAFTQKLQSTRDHVERVWYM